MVLKLALFLGYNTLKVYDDSLLVIDWISHNRAPKIIHLKLIYEEIIRIIPLFQKISFRHISTEWNVLTYNLSKQGLKILVGIITAWESNNDTIKELDPEPIFV